MAKGSRRAAKQRSELGGLLSELPVLIVAALGLALLIKTFLVQAFFIPSGSMEDTLQVGDRVLVNKLSVRFGEIQRGQVVVFEDPGGWLADHTLPPSPNPVIRVVKDVFTFVGLLPSESDKILIKRVVGVGGDRVVCCDEQGRITVNGVPLAEDYLYPGDVPSTQPFEVKVPEGRLWVLGDHRGASRDARAHINDPGGGTIPEENVIGRAFVIVWPIKDWSTLPIPDTFRQDSLQSYG